MSLLVEHYRGLARYNRWMNEKVYAAASSLPDEARKRDLGAFFRSLHGTLNHILLADRIWLGRIVGPVFTAPLDAELYADFDALRGERARTDDDIDAWVATLDEEKLAGPFRYTRRGAEVEHPLWQAALHLFNHQTHHRGQATTLLAQLGVDPGVTDLIALLRG
jgi:uncharacterized damage-inducible protein DinB